VKKMTKKISAYGMTAFAFFATNQFLGWPLIALSGIRALPFFGDLDSVLHSSDCAKSIGVGVYDSVAHPSCFYLYGYNLIKLFHLLQIDQSDTYLVGWVFILLLSLFIGTILGSLNDLGKRGKIFALSVLFSPPVMLLLERGNIDVLIFILLGIVSFLISRNKPLMAWVFLFLSAIFKFYTIPLFLLLSLFLKSKGTRFFYFAGFLLSSLIALSNILNINGAFPRNPWAAFGNPLLGLYLRKIGFPMTPIFQDLVGLILVLLGLTLIAKSSMLRSRISIWNFEIQGLNSFATLAQIFRMTFLICYFASANYDYRLLFMIVPALYYLVASRIDAGSKFSLAILLLISCWGSYNSGALQTIGDGAIFCWVLVFLRGIVGQSFERVRALGAPFFYR
jgi:hypothetical protein